MKISKIFVIGSIALMIGTFGFSPISSAEEKSSTTVSAGKDLKKVASQENSSKVQPSKESVSKKTSIADNRSDAMNFIDEVKKANDQFNQKNFSGCLDILKELYGKNPEIAPPYIYFAQWLAKDKNETDRFFNSLELAAYEYPNDPEAYILLGEISLQQKQYAAASLLLEKSTTLLEKYKDSYRKSTLQNLLLRSRIRLAEFRRDFGKMTALLDDLIKLNPKDTAILRQKASILFHQNKESEAQKLFEKADEIEKESKEKGIPALAAMAQLYLVRGDLVKATELLDKAVIATPESKEVLALAVVHRIRENKIDEADKFAERLMKADPNSPEPKRLAARLALFAENYAKAEKLFQELVVISPTDETAINGLALALCEQKDKNKLKRALEYARDNVRRNDQNPEYLGTLAWVLFLAENYNEASEILAKAISGKNFNITNMYYLARIALHSDKKEDAIKILDTILKKGAPFPKRIEAERILGEIKK